MTRWLLSTPRALALALSLTATLGACSREKASDAPAFREGDVLASKTPKVRISKILKIEGAGATFHMKTYGGDFVDVEEARRAYQAGTLRDYIQHAPIAGASYTRSTYVVLGNSPVTYDDLEGYREYLKMR